MTVRELVLMLTKVDQTKPIKGLMVDDIDDERDFKITGVSEDETEVRIEGVEE